SQNRSGAGVPPSFGTSPIRPPNRLHSREHLWRSGSAAVVSQAAWCARRRIKRTIRISWTIASRSHSPPEAPIRPARRVHPEALARQRIGPQTVLGQGGHFVAGETGTILRVVSRLFLE